MLSGGLVNDNIWSQLDWVFLNGNFNSCYICPADNKCIYMSCMKFSCSLIAFQYRLRLCICHWLYLHVKCWKNFSDLIHKREVITAFDVKECQDFGLHTCTGFIPLRILYAFSVVLCLLYCILNMRYKFRANLYYYFLYF